MSQEAAMSHAALVNDGLFWLVILMTVLLGMFLCAVVMAPPQEASRSSEEPPLGPPALPPPASVAALPSRRPPPPASPAGPASRPGGTGYAARHTPAAAAPVTLAPKAPSGPRRAPVPASILGIAGLAATVIGGWLLFGTRHAAVACRHQGVAICSEGFVVLTGAQVLGGAMAVAGIAAGFTALWLALR
jgi:hypothetical protein